MKFHFLTPFSTDFGQKGLEWMIDNFLSKFRNFEQKWVLGLGFYKKTPVWSKPVLMSCLTRFLFFNDFQILHAGSSTIKELWKTLIFESNLNFLRNMGFLSSSPNFFKIFMHPLILNEHFVWHIFIWLLVYN